MNEIVPRRGDNRDTLSGYRPQGVTIRSQQQQHHRIEIEHDDSFDISALWMTLKENRNRVFGIASVLFSLILVATAFSSMSFKSSGRLYLGELETKQGAGGNDLDLSGGSRGDVASEVEILKSQSLLSRAILDSGLNVSVLPSGWKRPRFLTWFLSRRDPELLAVPENSIVASHAVLAETYRGEQVFTAQMTGPRKYALYSAGELIGNGTFDLPLETESLKITLKQGKRGLPAEGESYTVTVKPVADILDDTLSALTVTTAKAAGGGEQAKVLLLEFTNKSPRLSAEFLTNLMKDYLDERQAWKSENANAAETFVTRQLQGLREALDTNEKKMAEYRAQTSGVALDAEAKSIIDQVGRYEEQRVNARLQVSSLSDINRVLKQPNPPLEAYLLGETSDPVLLEMASSLTRARQELTALEGRFADQAPEVVAQKSQVDSQLRAVRSYVSNRLARAQENLGSLNGVVSQFEGRLKSVPGAELGLAQLTRETEVFSRVYSYMLERQQQAAIVKASTVSQNRILDLPQLSYKEDSPKLMLRLLSAPLLLIFGALVVLGQRFFASTFQAEYEVRRAIGFLPVFASVPRRPAVSHDDAQLELDVVPSDLSSGYTEAFRTLRTNLHQLGAVGLGRVITVTSAQGGDGKTTVTLSFAATLASEGKRVLVVDTDFRNPSHHTLVGSRTTEGGMREVLYGNAKWQEMVFHVALRSGAFHSLSAGEMTPSELLSSDRMSLFLMEARQHYDYILLDAPSFPQIADALLLAQVSDIVLTVVRLLNTPRKLVIEHVRRLSEFARGFALVVNDSDVSASQPRATARLPVEKHTWLRASSRVRFVAFTAVALMSSLAAAVVVKGKRSAEESSSALRQTLENREQKAGDAQEGHSPLSGPQGDQATSAWPPPQPPTAPPPMDESPPPAAPPASASAPEEPAPMFGNPPPSRRPPGRSSAKPPSSLPPAPPPSSSSRAPRPLPTAEPDVAPSSEPSQPWTGGSAVPAAGEPLPDNPF
jgi:tyrosine-protein kinase Etk/Wzc